MTLENLTSEPVDYLDQIRYEALTAEGMIVGGFDARLGRPDGATKATLGPYEIRRFRPVELDTRSCKAARGAERELLPAGLYQAIAAISFEEPDTGWAVPAATVTITPG